MQEKLRTPLMKMKVVWSLNGWCTKWMYQFWKQRPYTPSSTSKNCYLYCRCTQTDRRYWYIQIFCLRDDYCSVLHLTDSVNKNNWLFSCTVLINYHYQTNGGLVEKMMSMRFVLVNLERQVWIWSLVFETFKWSALLKLD